MSELTKTFLNVSRIRIMYFLTKQDNPSEVKEIRKALETLSTKSIKKHLLKMIETNLVKEYKTGFDMTEAGLCSLYNFHKSYVEEKNE